MSGLALGVNASGHAFITNRVTMDTIEVATPSTEITDDAERVTVAAQRAPDYPSPVTYPNPLPGSDVLEKIQSYLLASLPLQVNLGHSRATLTGDSDMEHGSPRMHAHDSEIIVDNVSLGPGRSQAQQVVKVCFDCATTTTSLWRRDDEGNDLCNACKMYWGRYRIHRRVQVDTAYNAHAAASPPHTVPRPSKALDVSPMREGASDKENVFPTLAERTKLNPRRASNRYAQSFICTPAPQESRKRKHPDDFKPARSQSDKIDALPQDLVQDPSCPPAKQSRAKANPRTHNQYTPDHLRVQNGAPSLGPWTERRRKSSTLNLEETVSTGDASPGTDVTSAKTTTVNNKGTPPESTSGCKYPQRPHAADDVIDVDADQGGESQLISVVRSALSKRRFPQERTPEKTSKRLCVSQDLNNAKETDIVVPAPQEISTVHPLSDNGTNQVTHVAVSQDTQSQATVPTHHSTHLQSDIWTRLSSKSPCRAQREVDPSSHVTRAPAAGGSHGKISARNLTDIINYAEPGEDLDWTKVTDPRKRKKIHNLIYRRKHREKRLAAGGFSDRQRTTEPMDQSDAGNIEESQVMDKAMSSRGPSLQPRKSPSGEQSGLIPAAERAQSPLVVSPNDSTDLAQQQVSDGIPTTTCYETSEPTVYQTTAEAVDQTCMNSTPASVADHLPQPVLRKNSPSVVIRTSGRSDSVHDFLVPSAKTKPLRPPRSVKGLMTRLNKLVVNDAVPDKVFVDQMKQVLKVRSGGKALTFGVKQARRILHLLELASPPREGEALFLSGEEAMKQLDPGVFFPGPIFTRDQQPLHLNTVEEFLAEYYDDDAEVHVQDPGARVVRGGPHVRRVTMGQVKERFADPAITDKPWNLLELATHREDGLRPAFLNTEDCCLLSKLKIPSEKDTASRRGYEPGWKEIEKWALVAQAGALTEPHQDSHGYSTFITVNQGLVGFGWLSNPTEAERTAWRQSPFNFAGGRWRYTILHPGTTVYFPAGTVHFVFRHPAAGHTLAFGGHVLRCSQIARWAGVLLEEKRAPNITNEDMSVSAPAYLERVEGFVRQALKNGGEARWGGRENIEEFLRSKKEFMLGKGNRVASPPSGAKATKGR